MAIAFFDVDKTLLSVNSATLWIQRELRAGHISRAQAARAGLWVGLYHLGFARMEGVLTDAVATLKGKRERDVINRTLEFYEQEVRHTVRRAGKDAVDRHKAQGDLVFLLTSSSNYLSAPLSDLLQVDGFLANRFASEGGVLTGAPLLPFCFGEGKVAHAEGVCAKVGVRLQDCTFYTDSISDLPVLDRVARPVAVTPDPRLRRLALRRGWEIQQWDDAPLVPRPVRTPPGR
jgi:HAD superfamily hydrolase (TIGR01490 family)